jgi:uncharacterized GH25 family protein
MRISLSHLLTGSLLFAGTVAQAHSPYLLPNAFDVTQRDHVTVQASFTEVFFTPDIVMKAEDWHVLQPDGAKVALKPVYARDLALLEVETRTPGTYRVSTGLRTGRVAKSALIDGEWQGVGEGRELPAGTRVADMQSLTRADVYVSRGKPTNEALASTGKGVEFQMQTHPNSIGAGEPLRFVVLFEGKPLANQGVELQAGSGGYQGAKPQTLRSDAAGVVQLTPATPGVYHVMTRHRVESGGAGSVVRSYTYALTFEVQP